MTDKTNLKKSKEAAIAGATSQLQRAIEELTNYGDLREAADWAMIAVHSIDEAVKYHNELEEKLEAGS